MTELIIGTAAGVAISTLVWQFFVVKPIYSRFYAEVKAHADTVRQNEAEQRLIATALRDKGSDLMINDKLIQPYTPEELMQAEEWPEELS